MGGRTLEWHILMDDVPDYIMPAADPHSETIGPGDSRFHLFYSRNYSAYGLYFRSEDDA
jgi:hypothetical protein